jgi:4-hydroxy-3-methylbut-2-enyl diphosphate reductase IspH
LGNRFYLCKKDYICAALKDLKMTTLLSITDLIDNASRLESVEFNTFFNEILALRAKRVTTVLSNTESNLLKTIYQKMPNTTQKRYDQLTLKRQNETINEAEYAELLILVKEFEQQNVTRLKSIVELASIRKITAQELMKQLGLMPLRNA